MPTSAPSPELDESLNKRFLDAAQKGKDKLVKTLIEAGANLDWNDSNGENALMWAALNGHDNVVKTLIDAGARLDLTNIAGDSALILAAFKGQVEIVKTLIDAGAGVDLTNNHDDSALMIAANKGHAGVVNSLINAKANVNLINQIGESALMIAVSQGNVENVNSLIKARADVNFINQKYFYISALMIAVNRGDVENVNSLLDAGADLNLNYHGERALHDASCKGHFKIVNSLIVAGADVDCAPNEGFHRGRTALEYIALSTTIDEDAKKERLGFLLDIGANVGEEFSKNNAISLDIRNFVEEYIKPENALKREENLLKNTNLQDRFKESILAGKPITFRDKVVDKVLHNVVDKVVLNALKSITEKDLNEAGKENLDKLKESGVYQLLKISKHLSEDEFSLAARNLDAVKAIPDIVQKTFTNPNAVSSNLAEDMVSKILMYSLDPKEPPYGLGEKLTLKIIGILTPPATTSNSSTLLDPTSLGLPTQAQTINHSAPFGKSSIINPVVTADFVFVSGEVAKPYAQPSNPNQLPPQASTIGPSTDAPGSQKRTDPEVTAQIGYAPVPVAQENPSSITVVRPGFVKSQIEAIEEKLRGANSESR